MYPNFINQPRFAGDRTCMRRSNSATPHLAECPVFFGPYFELNTKSCEAISFLASALFYPCFRCTAMKLNKRFFIIKDSATPPLLPRKFATPFAILLLWIFVTYEENSLLTKTISHIYHILTNLPTISNPC